MKYFFKTMRLCILLLTSYPLYAQLAVNSDFNRDKCQLYVKLTNKSPFIMLFMTVHLLNPPSISIESFDLEMNAIEWLRYPPSEHNGPYLFDETYVILRQNESYLLSFNIKPDKTKKKPKYLIVTYNLSTFLLDVENTENETLFKLFQHLKGRVNLRFKEQFEFEKKIGDSVPGSENVK